MAHENKEKYVHAIADGTFSSISIADCIVCDNSSHDIVERGTSAHLNSTSTTVNLPRGFKITFCKSTRRWWFFRRGLDLTPSAETRARDKAGGFRMNPPIRCHLPKDTAYTYYLTYRRCQNPSRVTRQLISHLPLKSILIMESLTRFAGTLLLLSPKLHFLPPM